MKRNFVAAIVYTAFALCTLTLAFGAQEEEAKGKPSVFFPESDYTFEAVFEGTQVLHEFVIQNKGADALDVKRVSGG